MLVGRDLLARQPKSSSLPESGGLKRHWRDDADGAAAEVELARARWRLALTEERSAAPDQLADGEWLPDQRQVSVPGRARFSGQYGRRQPDGATLLQPEDALMLMELGGLIVRYGGLPLSIQQAYQTFLSSPGDFQRWLAYARLVRAGYQLVRHSTRQMSAAASAAAPPPASSLESRQFVLDLSSRPRRCIDPDLPVSTPISELEDFNVKTASSWSDYRAASSTIVVPNSARQLQAASFPADESLQPLVPWPDLLAGLSTADARQRMSVSEISLSNPGKDFDASVDDCRCAVCTGQLVSVDFDVFQLGHRRRRTAAGAALPDYWLVVVDVDSSPPCPVGVRKLQLSAGGSDQLGGVDLLFAIVDDASVHYQVYSACGVETIQYRF